MNLLFRIEKLSLFFPHKVCFGDFSSQIYYGDRIAVIGNNGSGKTMLLKILTGEISANSGKILKHGNFQQGYVPQTISDFSGLSGGERFNKTFTKSLSSKPDLLILDEPTNHLDVKNRRALIRLLKSYRGALLVATHDEELLRECVDILWHVDRGRIKMFSGKYEDYLITLEKERQNIDLKISRLNLEKKAAHKTLIKEQKRSKNSRLSGEKKIANKKVFPLKAQMMKDSAQKYAGKRKTDIDDKKEVLEESLQGLYRPEILKPKFNFLYEYKAGGTVIHIAGGTAGYSEKVVLSGISLTLSAAGRLAVKGDNGSGKSTLVKAILSDPSVVKSGEWYLPLRRHMGYLDQHYSTLDSEKTVYENAKINAPGLVQAELRSHLNDFLFRKNEEVNALVKNLSGGEKARLSLACMALSAPFLLVLDEITNNVDLSTKAHLAQIIREYPGTLIIISHDDGFLSEINITNCYNLNLLHL